jgi:choline transporter-like protein 2/4/5
MLLFMIFGILWIVAFIQAKVSFIAMVSTSTYYFNSSAEDGEGSAEVGLGFRLAYFYHIGSLAFGSFLVALIQFVSFIVNQVAKKAEEESDGNPAVKVVVNILRCCLKCLEEIVEYINAAAYAYMAVSGDSFCSSAWNGFLLHIKHTMKFAFANLLAAMFMLIGKLGIVALNVTVGYLIMKRNGDLDEVSSAFFPLFIIGLFAFVNASIFLSLFDEAVLAMLTCVAIDMDLNNGEPVKGPPTFHSKLSKVSERQEEEIQKANTIEEGGELEA